MGSIAALCIRSKFISTVSKINFENQTKFERYSPPYSLYSAALVADISNYLSRVAVNYKLQKSYIFYLM